ncbi:MAG: PLP-dependent aminotransferase family protein [Cyanothece sp. SIO1E1]|nr:PLP-dependent aminotransferase family protein [Cyanothece sp. SIO1E1]
MLPWKTIISIDRESSKAVYLQIVSAIIREVSQGRLQPGQRLPGTRKMGELLGINRKTIIVAYEELMAQGWIEVASSSGTFIAEHLPLDQAKKLGPSGAKPAGPTIKSVLPEHFPPVDLYDNPPPHRLSLNDGSPDVRLTPINIVLKHYRSAMNSYMGPKLLGYGAVEGQLKLREELAKYLSETRGLNCQAEEILITRGSNMALFLCFYALLEKGDKVIVTSPNYRSANWGIQAAQGELVEVGVDEEGVCVEDVKRVCQEHTIRAMYLTPHHHYPTTVTLCAERRMQLLQLSEEYNFLIFEDDYDYAFRYDSAPILPLASVDTSGRTLYIGSLSKMLAPAIRVGYLVAPAPVIRQLSQIRRIIDRQGDPPLEFALAQFIEEGELQRHLKKVVKVFEKRRDSFCELLGTHLQTFIDFTKPEGGMSVWAKFKQPVDAQALVTACLQHGLYLNVAHEFLPKYQGLRLGFASLNRGEQEEIVSILAKVLPSLQEVEV